MSDLGSHPDRPDRDGDDAQIPESAHQELEPVGTEDPSFFQHLPQFVLFPMLVVILAVSIIVFFKATTEENLSVSELLSEIKGRGLKHAAMQLSMKAEDARAAEERFSPSDTRSLIKLISSTDKNNPGQRTFLVSALGKAGDESLALDALLDLLTKPSASLEDRIQTIRGLGLSRSDRAIEPLLAELEKFQQQGDEVDSWEPRIITLSALINIASDREPGSALYVQIRDLLRQYVTDPAWVVSWNVAANLATRFHDGSGAAVLTRLLDREFIATQVPNQQEQDHWIQMAIRALAGIRHREAYPLIEALSEDPSMRVRNEVFQFRKRTEDLRARANPTVKADREFSDAY